MKANPSKDIPFNASQRDKAGEVSWHGQLMEVGSELKFFGYSFP